MVYWIRLARAWILVFGFTGMPVVLDAGQRIQCPASKNFRGLKVVLCFLVCCRCEIGLMRYLSVPVLSRRGQLTFVLYRQFCSLRILLLLAVCLIWIRKNAQNFLALFCISSDIFLTSDYEQKVAQTCTIVFLVVLSICTLDKWFSLLTCISSPISFHSLCNCY